jgi:hypothetical protein
MSNLEAGRKIRIEGREFTIQSVNDNAATGKRVTTLVLVAEGVEDAKPVGEGLFGTVLNSDFEPIVETLLESLTDLADIFSEATASDK